MPNSALSTFRLSAGTSIAQAQPPQQEPVTLASPGMAVMTDLTQVRAATVQPAAALAQAELMMIHQGVRLLFVVTQMPSVDGIVTAADLQGEKPLRLVSQRQVKFEDICVADVMTPLPDMDAIDFATLSRKQTASVATPPKITSARRSFRQSCSPCPSPAVARRIDVQSGSLK